MGEGLETNWQGHNLQLQELFDEILVFESRLYSSAHDKLPVCKISIIIFFLAQMQEICCEN